MTSWPGLRRRPRALPMPPLEMRALIGREREEDFDIVEDTVFSQLPDETFRSVFDFGCGCGRVARQLLRRDPVVERYLGIDLHAGMIRWCEENLTPLAPHFRFEHHDVRERTFNPGDEKPEAAPFPAEDDSFSLVVAGSVFTHLLERNAPFYLRECARILAPGGIFVATWFLMDKRDYPMMTEETNSLYVSAEWPEAAVIYDRGWLRDQARDAGLAIYRVIPPPIRGLQWFLFITQRREDVEEVDLPEDTGPRGEVQMPTLPADASRVGL